MATMVNSVVEMQAEQGTAADSRLDGHPSSFLLWAALLLVAANLILFAALQIGPAVASEPQLSPAAASEYDQAWDKPSPFGPGIVRAPRLAVERTAPLKVITWKDVQPPAPEVDPYRSMMSIEPDYPAKTEMATVLELRPRTETRN